MATAKATGHKARVAVEILTKDGWVADFVDVPFKSRSRYWRGVCRSGLKAAIAKQEAGDEVRGDYTGKASRKWRVSWLNAIDDMALEADVSDLKGLAKEPNPLLF